MNLARAFRISYIVLISVSFSFSQWNLYFDTIAGHDENLIHTYNKIEDQIIMPQIELSYTGNQYDVYYDGSFTQVVKNSQYNNAIHSVGIDFLKDIDHLHQTFGLDYAIRTNQEEYNYFDFWEVDGYYQISLSPTDWSALKAGVNMNYTHFPQEEAWDHYETGLSLNQRFFLPTRSTLMLRLNYLYRNFSPYRTYSVTQRISIDELPTLWQIVGSVRLAQSFGEHFGGYTEYEYRHNPSEGNPYQADLVIFSPIDDYFGYSGYRWNSNLKWKITGGFWSKIDFTQYQNTYINRPIYAYDFDAKMWIADTDGNYTVIGNTREDHGHITEISAGYKLNNLNEKASSLELSGAVTFFNNRSNDKYFEYTDVLYGLRVSYNLQW
ncbi:MAG: hypothetical protein COT43_04415 [Candidatus Marinimicrobia bacterium CG08_land_8_20_14_0_20_45_22]|nr:MAG: hypothetical protein COT43_04415 [Candidatus Marinimicrobia bacterium CG08_land_8_20_14_0_20_45_22]